MRGQGHARGSVTGQGCDWHRAHWEGCAWSCCCARRGKAEHPDPRFNSVLCRAEELFSVFLRFTLSLFLSLFFFFFNCLSTSLAPSHATVLPAALEGNEAFAAKSDPCLFPSPPILGLAYVCSAKGARARFTWACSLLLSLCCCRYRLAACLAFEPARGWTALGWAAQHPSLPTHTEIVV